MNLQKYIGDWRTKLQIWANQGALISAASRVLVLNGIPETLLEINNRLTVGEWSVIPSIKLLRGTDINGARGAWSTQTKTIYLNADWLENAQREDIFAVLTEEFGHYLDSIINTLDTPGDEGDYFARVLAHTESVSPVFMRGDSWEQEDDSIVIMDSSGISIMAEASYEDYLANTGEYNIIRGTVSSDRLIGGSDLDLIIGDSGYDFLDGGDNPGDLLYGGQNNDTYYLRNINTKIHDSGTDTLDTIKTEISYDLTLATGIERLEMMGSDNLYGVGGNSDEIFLGNTGNNILQGEGGNDVFAGRGGHDIYIGGTGRDYYFILGDPEEDTVEIIDDSPRNSWNDTHQDTIITNRSIDLRDWENKVERIGFLIGMNPGVFEVRIQGDDDNNDIFFVANDGEFWSGEVNGSAVNDQQPLDESAILIDGGDGNDRIFVPFTETIVIRGGKDYDQFLFKIADPFEESTSFEGERQKIHLIKQEDFSDFSSYYHERNSIANNTESGPFKIYAKTSIEDFEHDYYRSSGYSNGIPNSEYVGFIGAITTDSSDSYSRISAIAEMHPEKFLEEYGTPSIDIGGHLSINKVYQSETEFGVYDNIIWAMTRFYRWKETGSWFGEDEERVYLRESYLEDYLLIQEVELRNLEFPLSSDAPDYLSVAPESIDSYRDESTGELPRGVRVSYEKSSGVLSTSGINVTDEEVGEIIADGGRIIEYQIRQLKWSDIDRFLLDEENVDFGIDHQSMRTDHLKLSTLYTDKNTALMANDVQTNLILTGSEPITGEGNDKDNRISGNISDNLLIGGGGADLIKGGLGDDTLLGGAGNDLIYGSNGDDKISGDEGDDYINGGEGEDKVLFDGRLLEYKISLQDAGNLLVSDLIPNRDGNDTLELIDELIFMDGNLAVIEDRLISEMNPVQRLDHNRDEKITIQEDAIIGLRMMFGTFPGDALTDGALTESMTTGASEVNSLLSGYIQDSTLDLDSDGIISPFTDGMQLIKEIEQLQLSGGVDPLT